MKISEDDQAWLSAALTIAGITCFTIAGIGVDILNWFWFFGLMFLAGVFFLIPNVIFPTSDNLAQFVAITLSSAIVAYSANKLVYGLMVVLGIS